MLWLVAGALLFLAVQSIANVESTIEDMGALGRAETRAHVWIWQLSSVLVWLATFPAIWWLVARLRPPRFSWGVAVLLHALATVPLSLIHVIGMVVLRQLAYAAGGETYVFGDWAGELLYEYRKDVSTYVMAAAFLAYAQWVLAPVEAEGEAEPLLIPDGSITRRVPVEEIDWVASAANYVELGWRERVLLHRSTLAAMADRLGPGFVRIHRGRLVRRAAIRSIETDRSGDFTVTLASGAQLRGSRRYRQGLGG
jgi:hypothetical protein